MTRQFPLDACQVETIPAPADVERAPAVSESPNSERRELPEEGLQFIRGIALLLLPPKFEDEDGWGNETRIQSGLEVDFEDGKLETSRRWKNVNHGSWLQGSGELVEPEKTFHLSAAVLPDSGEKTNRYEIHVSTRLRVTGRQQQWNYGVMLWSISADALADVSMHVVVDVTSEVVTTENGVRLRFEPNVIDAGARLDGFSLRRISHAKGAAVREFGDWLEKLIRIRIKRENKNLAARINKAIRKKPDTLEIPLDIGAWFGFPEGNAGEPKSALPVPALQEERPL